MMLLPWVVGNSLAGAPKSRLMSSWTRLAKVVTTEFRTPTVSCSTRNANGMFSLKYWSSGFW